MLDRRKKEGKKGSGGRKRWRRESNRRREEQKGEKKKKECGVVVSFLKEDLEFENFKICFILILSLCVCVHL